MKKTPLLLLCLMTLIVCSCSSDEPESNNDRKDIELDLPSRVAADNLGKFYVNFTIDAAKYIDSEDSINSKNIILSPFSASMAMSLMANAVDGDLQQELINYLEESDLEGINTLAKTLLTKLPYLDNKTTLTFANSVWTDKKYTLNDDFLSLALNNYICETNTFDLANMSKSINDINKWCNQKTNGAIKKIIDGDDLDYFVLFLNAMYFKSSWGIENFFDKEKTKYNKFYGRSRESMTYLMKSGTNKLQYYANEDFGFVSIPFGNSAFSLDIILPQDDKTIDDITPLLTSGSYASSKAQASKYDVYVTFPKFKIEQSHNLNDLLASSGIPHINQIANMTSFNNPILSRIEFKQKISLEINEKGAVAAAVSSGGGGYTSMPITPTEPVDFNVNRPFYFFITEQSTGACIVSGRIVDLGD